MTNQQPTVIRAKVALDWLQSIVGEFFGGTIDHPTFQAKMRDAWDSIKADGLTEEVSALWRISTYGAR